MNLDLTNFTACRLIGSEEIMYKLIYPFALLLLFHTTALFALEVPLEYLKDGEKPNSYYHQKQIDGWFSTSVPSGNWKLPLFKSEFPFFAILELGDRPHLMALDVEKNGMHRRTTLYVDCNGNGDLTDDSPIKGPSRGWRNILFGGSNRFLSGPLNMTVMDKGVSTPYCLRVELVGKHMGWKNSAPAFRWIPHCQYRAVIDVGKKYTILLPDYNHNALFGDRTIYESTDNSPGFLRPEDDFFYLFSNDIFDCEKLKLNSLLVLENKIYRLNADIAARKLILTEIDKNLAPLKLGMIPDCLTLFSVNNNCDVTLYRPADALIMLPYGEYRLISYRISRKDENGDSWYLSAVSGKSPSVSVAKENKSSLIFGEPYLVKADISTSGRANSGNRNVSMKFQIKGQGDENIDRVTLYKSSAFEPSMINAQQFRKEIAPYYVMVKSNGEMVSWGSFRHG